MENENSNHLKMLLQSLQLLAAPYEQQIQVLPPFVDIPDEIALIFDDVYVYIEDLAQRDLITPHQKRDLERMDSLLNHMSNEKEIWTLDALPRCSLLFLDALKESPDWKQIRSLATRILESLKESKQPPNLFWLQYFPDEKGS